MSRVDLNEAAIAALGASAEVERAIQRVGDQVADRAAQAAPKDSGAGAESIHAEIVEGFGGVKNARVSWDSDHFYMLFHEVGTSEMSARPFLRPALDGQYEV